MEPDADVIPLEDYLLVLRRRWWIALLVALVTVGAALGVSFWQTPVYEAEAEVVVSQVRRTEDVSLEELLTSDTVVQTQRRVMTSGPVTDRVIEQLGLDVEASELTDKVDVTAVTDTRVLRVAASDTDPAFAAELANGFANAYLDYRRDQAVDDLLAAQDALGQRAQDLQEQISDLENQIADASGGEQAALEAQRDALLSQLEQIATQTSSVTDAREAIRGGGDVLTAAEVPEEPSSPQPLRNGALATVLGLMLGVGVAFLVDHFDDAVRERGDLKRATGGLPVLGQIPHWDDAESGRVATLVAPHGLAAEAYRTLSVNVRFLLAGGHDTAETTDGSAGPVRGRSVTVTSAGPKEGKTSTACNLAVAAARSGLSVVLVDGDLRRPTLEDRFGLGDPPGLADLVAAGPRSDVRDYLIEVGGEWLKILPAGTLPPNPSQLLSSPGMSTIHDALVDGADLVIYDSPPVLAVADPLELASRTTHTIIVGRVDQSSRRDVADTVERITNVGGRVAGSVFNDLREKSRYGYYGYYSYAAEGADRPDRRTARSRVSRSGRGRRQDQQRGRSRRRGRHSEPEDTSDPEDGTSGRSESIRVMRPPVPTGRDNGSPPSEGGAGRSDEEEAGDSPVEGPTDAHAVEDDQLFRD